MRPSGNSRASFSHGTPRTRATVEVSSADLRLALARLPNHVGDALRLFSELTGFTAVASFRSSVPDSEGGRALSPPMHSLCASRLHAAAADACEEAWLQHLRDSLRSPCAQSHVCTLGLRCACIPIYYRESLLGVAKCVTDRKTERRRFSTVVRILELAIAKECQDFCVEVHSRELETCRERMERLQQIAVGQGARGGNRAAGAVEHPSAGGTDGNGSLVDRALKYIASHYLEHGLTLSAISRELGVTEKHLTSLFTRTVGQRMRAYIVRLRVQHACHLILVTGKSVKQVAYESGFNRVDVFRRSFSSCVGVSPSAYRRAFGGG